MSSTEGTEKPIQKPAKASNEQRYFDALKRIASYQPSERLLRHGEQDWGVSGPEALEMAYDNIQGDAKRAIYGRRRPK